MASFLFAWEIGAGMGHTVPLAQVAQPLVERGHSLHFVLRDLSGARTGLGGLIDSPLVRLWQAPIWLPDLHSPPPAASYAELLYHAGYLDVGRLSGLVRAWRSLFDAIQPDLLLADHAPTAMLASRAKAFPKAVIGNGFFFPPAMQPLPSFRKWERVDKRRLELGEARVLATCNSILEAEGVASMAALHELTSGAEQLLVTWPELDPYASGADGRPGGHYWGTLPARSQGLPAVWADGDGPKVFAYLKGDYPSLQSVLQQLAKGPWRTLAHVPGVTPEQRRRFSNPRLSFSDGAVAMHEAVAQAEAVVCHSGAGTVATTLAAGLPLLLLPMQVEQMVLSLRVVESGAGALVRHAETGGKLRPALKRILGDCTMLERIRRLAARNSSDRYGNVAERVAARCEALAESGVNR